MAATTTTAVAAKASVSAPKLKRFVSLLFLLVLLLSTLSGTCGGSASRIRAGKIPSCCDMSSEEQCSQNPSCRWCRSESLDDMCFPKSEALRLPPQVFTCKLIRFSQKF